MRTFIAELDQHQAMIEKLRACAEVIDEGGKMLVDTIKQGGKLLMCGNGSSELAEMATLSVVVPEEVTARIQEGQILIGHGWCGLVEEAFSDSDNA